MPAAIPESHLDLLSNPVYGVLSTQFPNGEIQSTLVWVGYQDGYLFVNTKRGREKEKNIARNPHVTLMLVDTTNPWKYLSIRGVVSEVIEQGAVEHLDSLTLKYLGQPNYYGFVEPPEALEGITRCMLKIEPTKVMTVGQ